MQRQTLSASGLSSSSFQTVLSSGASLAAQTILPDFAFASVFPFATRPAAGRHLSNASTTNFHSPASASYGRNHEPPAFVMAAASVFDFSAASPLKAHPNADMYMDATDGYPAFIAFSASCNAAGAYSSIRSRFSAEVTAKNISPVRQVGDCHASACPGYPAFHPPRNSTSPADSSILRSKYLRAEYGSSCLKLDFWGHSLSPSLTSRVFTGL